MERMVEKHMLKESSQQTSSGLIKRKVDFSVVWYSLAVGVLTIFFAVIIVRVLFIPLCIPTTQGSCPVDGGSIAGFAGAILGLAAALLVLLGAFAVAYWWANLDEKVNRQVERRINEEIDTMREGYVLGSSLVV